MNKPLTTSIPFTLDSTYTTRMLLDMSNIDRFNECSTRLFATLYENFPLKVRLDYHAWLQGEPAGDGARVDLDDFSLCQATVEWLDEAGYITVKHYTARFADGVSLAAKGLEVLKAVPSSLEARQSVGDAMVAFSKGAVRMTATELMSTAMTEGFRLMVRLNG